MVVVVGHGMRTGAHLANWALKLCLFVFCCFGIWDFIWDLPITALPVQWTFPSARRLSRNDVTSVQWNGWVFVLLCVIVIVTEVFVFCYRFICSRKMIIKELWVNTLYYTVITRRMYLIHRHSCQLTTECRYKLECVSKIGMLGFITMSSGH